MILSPLPGICTALAFRPAFSSVTLAGSPLSSSTTSGTRTEN
jgi:hypothetical protein